MVRISEKLKKAAPWIEPVLDYFDWRKRIIATAVATGLAGWSVVKGEPWPMVAALGFSMLVVAAYALVFPAFLKLVNVGYQPRPDTQIWKYKKQFQLCEAACLLADTVPVYAESAMNASALAWFVLLCDAVSLGEIERIKSKLDNSHHQLGTDYNYQYLPHTGTVISRDILKKFVEARERKPEFLAD
jgi:hypothetical protein